MDIEKKVWEVLLSEDEITKRVKKLGQELSKEYRDKKLIVVSLLKGSFIFTADLVRQMTIPVKVEFMTTSSYGHGEESSGAVKIVVDIEKNLEGYDVLVVDDITDSGLTMKYVMEHLKQKNPASVKCCVLLDKPERRQVDLDPNYLGFTIPDKFVVGYGLNFGDYYRNIPYVFVVTDKDR
ncbi:hypoxanthine phosphoribosyltransferase [Alkaliphilus peptidifermentans]|uniref:Hypoxanthine phosphoribosyltransferase n=1 Tax=Alkaliphilus peptidifermentans DSM 18978 TaxID=1120976 RepID=A0A1G5K9T0_9FIRM|nr:hypoxanthine phosphoribosyltransferase [Alkaliphilus peptidifermentans]SCY96699.1 hypoxanthine phosphoribosyltransferase [Alkaliphilus peptidifermentans DSM 18978]